MHYQENSTNNVTIIGLIFLVIFVCLLAYCCKWCCFTTENNQRVIFNLALLQLNAGIKIHNLIMHNLCKSGIQYCVV